jgi:hypothetical protein
MPPVPVLKKTNMAPSICRREISIAKWQIYPSIFPEYAEPVPALHDLFTRIPQEIIFCFQVPGN